jgi:uncharacterized protein YlzI (FlbEa/FlbD family)
MAGTGFLYLKIKNMNKEKTMNHLIWITTESGNCRFIPAGQVAYFERMESNPERTIVQMSDGRTFICKTAPEDLEKRINKYMNDMLDYMHSRREL